MNRVLLVGRIGQKPELTTFENGQVVNLSVATNENYKNQQGDTVEKTEWHRIVAYGKLAGNVAKFMDKGSLISVEGKLQTRDYDKDGKKVYITEILANKIGFLDKKSDQTPKQVAGVPAAQEDDDLPF